MAKSAYKMLFKSRWSISGKRYALYRTGDHLLSLISNGYTERYRRFYYRDIHALVVTTTPAGQIWNVIFGVLGTALMAGFLSGNRAYLIPGGLCFLALLINTVLGPTCVCRITTAVQTEKLPSLTRRRKADKAIALLKPLIEKVQSPDPAYPPVVREKSTNSDNPDEFSGV